MHSTRAYFSPLTLKGVCHEQQIEMSPLEALTPRQMNSFGAFYEHQAIHQLTECCLQSCKYCTRASPWETWMSAGEVDFEVLGK